MRQQARGAKGQGGEEGVHPTPLAHSQGGGPAAKTQSLSMGAGGSLWASSPVLSAPTPPPPPTHVLDRVPPQATKAPGFKDKKAEFVVGPTAKQVRPRVRHGGAGRAWVMGEGGWVGVLCASRQVACAWCVCMCACVHASLIPSNILAGCCAVAA